MARIHGRRGVLYLGLASASAVAEPVTFLTKWTIDFATDKVDMTAMQDNNKTYASGLPDAKGTYNGWYDDATAQVYTAAIDGAARRFYLYPANSDTAEYFFGTGIFDFSVAGGHEEGVSISGSWAAGSTVAKVAS